MTRTMVHIGVAALAIAVVVGGLLALSQGSVDAGNEQDPSGRNGPQSAAPVEAAKLDAIDDPGTPHREAVAESPHDEVVAPGEAPPFELASASGVLILPEAFEPSEPVMVYAWPVEGGEHRPVELEIEASAKEWTFGALPVGSWVFTARAVADDHCAWGKSREVSLASGDDLRGVEVRAKEFGVRGLAVDTNGVPLSGIPVRYSLAELDQTVGSIGDWTPPRDPDSPPPTDDPWRVAIENFAGGGEYEFMVGGTVVTNDRVAIDFGGSSAEVRVAPVSIGEPSTALDAARSATDTALLEALTRQVEIDMQNVVFESPNPGGQPLIRPSSSEDVGQWLFPGGLQVDEEEVLPAVPSSGTVTTGANGEFWIALPGPGKLTMTVDATSLERDGTDPGFQRSRTSVELTMDAPVTDHQITLERAAALVGRLVRADGVLEGIYVFIRSVEGGDTDVTRTESDGYFSFSGKRPGRYLVYSRSGGSEGRDFCTDADLQLQGGTVHRLDDVLTASSSMSGVVVDTEGHPVPDAPVVAFGADNRSVKRSGRTDAMGVFTIAGMYAVDYTLEVSGQVIADGARFHVRAGGGTANAGTLTLGAPPATDQ